MKIGGTPSLGSFRPILSAIGTPTYSLAKFLVPILSSITINEYTVRDSFAFADEILQQDSNLFMASLDVESLFTNIPLKETIGICVNNLFADENSFVNGLPKNEFRKLLELAATESFFLFNDIYYKQIDGVAMGSPLGPTLANAFMCHFEKKWLEECPQEYKPLFYRRYVDDIFVLFSSSEHLTSFLSFMNSRHPNIRFTKEEEQNDSLSFLDILVSRDVGKFVTNIYRKPTFSGVYSHFDSFIPLYFKHGLILSLLYRLFRLCSDHDKFHQEVSNLKSILSKNKYPSYVIDFCVRRFLNKIYQPKVTTLTVPKRELFITLPFLGPHSLQLRTRLSRFLHDKLPHCTVRFVFKSTSRLHSFFHFKDRISKLLRSGLVYKFKCDSCNAIYYGKTIRHFKVRICEHLAISHLTEKPVHSAYHRTAVYEHRYNCDHSPSFDNFSILCSDSNDFKLTVKESLLINRDRPPLNKTVTSLPLELF